VKRFCQYVTNVTKVNWRSVGIQFVSEPEIYQGAGFKLRADARFVSRSFSEGWCPGARTITNLS
jgi:hypothetical protein